MKWPFTLLVLSFFLLPVALHAQEEKVDMEMIKKIRDEEMSHSLTDQSVKFKSRTAALDASPSSP